MDRFDVAVGDAAACTMAAKQVLGLCQSVFDRFISATESLDSALLSCSLKVTTFFFCFLCFFDISRK
jgi:hypothetical protein